MICTVDLDKLHRQGPGYWKLNASFPARKVYRDRISELVKRQLTGAIVNNRWWANLKWAIRVESIKFSKELAVENNRLEGELVSKLEEAIRTGIATDVLAARMALDHFFAAKHQGCVVRAKARALKCEGTKAVRWARVAEAQRGNKTTIRSLTDPDGHVLLDSKQMCAAFQQHFAQLFGASGERPSETALDFSAYLNGLPRLSAVDAESCEKPITADEIRMAVSGCAKNKSPGLDGLPYELYTNMPDLFGDLLADVYCNWQQNGRIPSSVSRGVVTLQRKDADKGDVIDNFRPITLLNAEFKILAKVLANRLALVVEKLVGEAQTCAIPGRSIHDNLHLVRYIIERVSNKPGFGRAMINVDQSKAFDRVDHRYLAAVLRAAGLGPVFRGWIASMYSGICSVVKLNGHLSEPFQITRSVRQGCPLSSLLYVLTLEPLLRKLEASGGILLELGCTRAVSAYADDVTVMVSDTTKVEVVGTILKEYEAVTGAKINPDKSVGLRLGTWRGRPMPSNSVVGRWTDGPVKLLGVWFGPDLQLDRNWDEVTSKVASLTQKWAERKLSLKGRAEVANTYIASIIIYRLTVVPCPSPRLTRLERLLFRFLWKGRVPLVRRSICCQHPLKGGLGMPWLLMRRHALRLRHLKLFLDGEQVWSPFVRHVFPRLVSLMELQSWVKRRPRLGAWHLECCQALTALYQSSNTVSVASTQTLYRGLVLGKRDDVLGETLGADESELAGLFRRTFGPGTMDNFQKSLAWQCYRKALPVRDKLHRHGSAVSRACPRCAQGDETVLHALVQCPDIANLWSYVEQLLSRMEQTRLSAESIVRIAPPPSFGREGQAVFLCLVAMAKEVVWWTRLKGLKTDTFLSGHALTDFFKFHLERKVRVEREVLSSSKFNERWVRVASMARVNGTTLSMHL